jgi:hypothetical protein
MRYRGRRAAGDIRRAAFGNRHEATHPVGVRIIVTADLGGTELLVQQPSQCIGIITELHGADSLIGRCDQQSTEVARGDGVPDTLTASALPITPRRHADRARGTLVHANRRAESGCVNGIGD